MFIGFGYAARQQARNAAIDAADAEGQAADQPRTASRMHSSGPVACRRPVPRQRKNATAEEEEDAILDAQGF